MIKLRLADGIIFEVQSNVDEFTSSFESAIRNQRLIDVENSEGVIRFINPTQILYYEAMDDE